MRRDPRDSQIAILLLLLSVGIGFRGISISLLQIAISVASALAVQAVATAIQYQVIKIRGAGAFGFTPFEWRSALITGLSLSLLLRVDHLAWAAIAAVIAISAKFLIRVRGRHVFNPANFALVVLLLGCDSVWLSPGQWGTELLLLFGLAVLGMVVLSQTRQWDIAFVFLSIFGAMLVLRALYLGDPLAIPRHQLGNGALLIFSFFMLSDPKTIPPTLRGRMVFALVVAVVAYLLRFFTFVHEAIFYALFGVCGLYALFRLFLSKEKPYETLNH